MKCLFPAAGYGTRFLPVTKAIPKEMLPVLNKPLIQYGVEEALEACFTTMAIVTGRGKRAIEDHFDKNYELEHQLKLAKKDHLLREINGVLEQASFTYIRQNEMRGLGDAILTGEKLVGNESFGVLLADDLCTRYEDGETNQEGVLSQLLRVHKKFKCSVVAIEEVALEEASKYGIIEGDEFEEGIFKISNMNEKPSEPKSNLAVIGRYILTPSIFSYLASTKADARGEVQITDALNAQAKEEMVLALKFKGRRFDCGTFEGYLRANNFFYEHINGLIRD